MDERGHRLTYVALVLFTMFIWIRPADVYPTLLTRWSTFIVGIMTLLIYIVSQVNLERNLTSRVPEIYLVLIFYVTGILSVPFALNQETAWSTLTGGLTRCVLIFIVMVNVVRTEFRLRWLINLAIGVSCFLSLRSLYDYRLQLSLVEGYRVGGFGGALFGNTNDLALQLVTILPLAIVSTVAARGVLLRCIFSVCSALMVVGTVVTYSRGAFLGGVACLCFLFWKIGRRYFPLAVVAVIMMVYGFWQFAPANYLNRIASIFDAGLDPGRSYVSRQEQLIRSIEIAFDHPMFGIGMGNYVGEVSVLATHNAFTQVASEMGFAALIVYCLFIVIPFYRLDQIGSQIGSETRDAAGLNYIFYLSVGLQASLIGYAVTSFFLSVAYIWYIYYLVGYAVCARRIYDSKNLHRAISGRTSIERRPSYT